MRTRESGNGLRRRLVVAVGLMALATAAGATTVVVAGSGPRVEGSGNVVEEVRAVTGFNRLVLEGPMDVQLRRAASERVVVRADDNIVPLIETRVEGGRLIVGVRRETSFRTRSKLVVQVDFTQLDGVQVRGSGDISADRVKASIFEGTIHGSGNVRINELDAETVALSIAGSGNFNARGRAGTVGVVIEGSGDVHVENLEAKTAAVRIAGSGDARVHASESLQVRIAGSGDVRYRGSPQVDKKVAGSGDVRPMR
jgi:hypothetical protein